jgi:hypothetical protein
MFVIIALPKLLFSFLHAVLFPKPKREYYQKASYRPLPDKPTDQTIQHWMRYLDRRFPHLCWEHTVKGEWVYIRITAPDPGFLTGLNLWLGGGTLTETAFVYAVPLS